MTSILFRCDGSVEIGMGHVIRCLALADELRNNHNCNIHFAMRRSQLGVCKVKVSYPVIESNEVDEKFDYANWLQDCIKKTNTQILILDVRGELTRQDLKQIKKKFGIKVVTIDDPEEKRLEADMAFYPPVPQLKNANWDGFKGELYIGWEYVILRNEFLKQYPKPNNSIPNILVSMGGADPNNLTDYIVRKLVNLKTSFKAIIILGPLFSGESKLLRSLENVTYQYEIIHNVTNISKIMAKSDFAIVTFGVTAYELAAVGVPALHLSISEDHLASSQLFVDEGLAISVGLFSEITSIMLIESIQRMIDKSCGLGINRNIVKIIDGVGTTHISRLIFKLLEG